MSILEISEEEKKKISNQHKTAIKSDIDKKEDLKKGLKTPEKKDEKKTSN
jgi:hypothetical protein